MCHTIFFVLLSYEKIVLDRLSKPTQRHKGTCILLLYSMEALAALPAASESRRAYILLTMHDSLLKQHI